MEGSGSLRGLCENLDRGIRKLQAIDRGGCREEEGNFRDGEEEFFGGEEGGMGGDLRMIGRGPRGGLPEVRKDFGNG